MRTLVWDVDDVLNDLTRAWFDEAYRPAHPSSPVRYEDLRDNPPHGVLGLSLGEYLASLDAFRRARQHTLTPSAAALAWFERCGEASRHLALTAMPAFAVPVGAAWVLTHFGRWIRAFSFVPSPREGDLGPVYDRTKGDLLAWLGCANVIIDDRPDTIAAARSAGLVGVLAPQPWNGAPGSLSDALASLDPRPPVGGPQDEAL